MARDHTATRSSTSYRSHHDRQSPTRLRSPRRKHHRTLGPRATVPVVSLPYNARQISRHDLQAFRPMFALYLDIQKNLSIEDLSLDEVKGRWKSFVRRWNLGELAEGWYDPGTLEKAKSSSTTGQHDHSNKSQKRRRVSPAHDSTDEDDYGPLLPGSAKSNPSSRNLGAVRAAGPAIPSLQDLQVKRETAEEDATECHDRQILELRRERRADRHMQKERLDELVPKAEPGTRERQLEKKREKADSNRAFAAGREEFDPELRDADVMGDEDSMSALKTMKQENERKKNERVVRREEVLRARRAEREERVREMREKEETTMSMLKELARARFGGGGR